MKHALHLKFMASLAVKYCLLSALTILAVPMIVAQNCLPTTEGIQSNDNLANNASPFMFAVGTANPWIVYDNHSTNSVYADYDFFGSEGGVGNGQPVTTSSGAGFGIGSGGFGDVTGTYANGTVFIDFLDSAGQIEVISGNIPAAFSVVTSFSSIGGLTVNTRYTPALATYQNDIYMAFVSGSSIYLAKSTNGATYSLVSSTPLSYVTRSRPSLAVYDGGLYVAYTTTNGNVVSGTLYSPSNPTVYAPSLTYYSWQLGYKNANGVYAGVGLVPYSPTGQLYLEGQSTVGSQYLYSTNSSTGLNFPAPISCGAQLRWTPSGVYTGSFGLVLVFQDAFNTQIWANY